MTTTVVRRWFPLAFALLLFAACGTAVWLEAFWATGAVVALALSVVLLWERRCAREDTERATEMLCREVRVEFDEQRAVRQH